MTVEASLIYPFVIGGILFTMYLGFYLYNAVAVRQIVYVAALRASQQNDLSETRIREYVSKQLETLAEDTLFFVEKTQEETEVSKTRIKVTLKIRLKTPFTGLPLVGQNWKELEISEEVIKVRPVNIIRDVRKLYEG